MLWLMNQQPSTLPVACSRKCPLRNHPCFSIDLALENALSLLAEMKSATLMMKDCGLTTLSKIKLGRFLPGKGLLHDEASNLRISNEVKLTAFRCPLQGCFRVALSSHPHTGPSYLGFNQVPWDSEEAQTLRTQLRCRPRELYEPCLKGCQMWLDDWTDQRSKICHDFKKERILQLIGTTPGIEVEISQGGVNRVAAIHPHFLDSDGDILRIRESGQTALAIINMAQANFVATRDCLRISTN